MTPPRHEPCGAPCMIEKTTGFLEGIRFPRRLLSLHNVWIFPCPDKDRGQVVMTCLEGPRGAPRIWSVQPAGIPILATDFQQLVMDPSLPEHQGQYIIARTFDFRYRNWRWIWVWKMTNLTVCTGDLMCVFDHDSGLGCLCDHCAPDLVQHQAFHCPCTTLCEQPTGST